jgi:transcriptional regulator with XRE-family HTH domain
MSFGSKLKQIRKEYNLTQEEMSEKLIIEQSTYSRYETDKKFPTMDFVKRVVDTFNISLEWLMQTDSKTVIFEQGSTNHIGVVQADNYYAVPKDLIENLMQQFQNFSMQLKEIIKTK